MKEYKICVLGSNVGKTQLIYQYINGDTYQFHEFPPTVEDTYLKNVVVDGEECNVSITDTSGSDILENLITRKWYAQQWVRNNQAFVLVFGINSLSSFDIIQGLFDEIKRVKKGEEFPLVLVGTQLDTVDRGRKVTEKEGEALAFRMFNCPYIETSAKTPTNTSLVFEEVIQQIKNLDSKPNTKSTGSKKSQGSNISLRNPQKAGPLLKLGGGVRRVMQKRFFAVQDGTFYFYKSKKDFEEGSPHKFFSLTTSTVRPLRSKPYYFELTTLAKTYMLQADSAEELESWITTIQSSIVLLINNGRIRRESVLPTIETKIEVEEIEKPPKTVWHEVQNICEANTICADCSASNPDWCSVSLGILICLQCASIHKKLGFKVQSMILDEIEPEIINLLKWIGNENSNYVWEGGLTAEVTKPCPRDTRSFKENYINLKYVKAQITLPTESSLDKDLFPILFNEAIFNGELITGLHLFTQKISLNWKNPKNDGQSFLHQAITSSNLLFLIFLLENGADPAVLDDYNRTPLDLAIELDFTKAIEILEKREPEQQQQINSSVAEKEEKTQNVVSAATILGTLSRNRPQRTSQRLTQKVSKNLSEMFVKSPALFKAPPTPQASISDLLDDNLDNLIDISHSLNLKSSIVKESLVKGTRPPSQIESNTSVENNQGDVENNTTDNTKIDLSSFSNIDLRNSANFNSSPLLSPRPTSSIAAKNVVPQNPTPVSLVEIERRIPSIGIKFTITGHTMKQTEDKDWVVYLIQVDAPEKNQYVIQKRFMQFEELNEALQELKEKKFKPPKLTSDKVPDKQNDPAFLQKRKKKLHEYLCALSLSPFYSKCELFIKFINSDIKM